MELTTAVKEEEKPANKRQYLKNNKDKCQQCAKHKMKFYCPVCEISVYNMPLHLKAKRHKDNFNFSLFLSLKNED